MHHSLNFHKCQIPSVHFTYTAGDDSDFPVSFISDNTLTKVLLNLMHMV